MTEFIEGDAILFMPEISGFTKFIHDNEITHSQQIIQHLLEGIIESDKIGMQVIEEMPYYFAIPKLTSEH